MPVSLIEERRRSELHRPTTEQLKETARMLNISGNLQSGCRLPGSSPASASKRNMGCTARRVIMAQEVGFCFGVKRAIDLTRQALAERLNVTILGDLIHNRHVTDQLAAEGLRRVDDIEAVPGGTMVIRAHGLPKATIREAKEQGLKVVDATCPIVHRTQEAAQSLEKRGYQVVIIGDKNHAEVIGIVGALEQPALVIGSLAELHQAKERYELKRRVGVVFQTTLALELCREIVNELVLLCKETNIINTTCRPVQNRQKDALEIAKKVDLMIIVGGKSSHNTQGLAALCRTCNPNTIHVENADQLDYETYKDCSVIGIASGLSAPTELVEAVRAKVLGEDSGPGVPW
jgi:(E)-4-hydroxy-3-methyl-but-2-enyl pyrophosphate reductase